MTSDDRIIALAEGREVGDDCMCHCHKQPEHRPCNLTGCAVDPACTGRINTEPANETERVVARLYTEREEARDWVRRMTRDTQVLTCVYCGQAYPPGSPSHGADVLTAQVAQLEGRIAELEGESLAGDHNAEDLLALLEAERAARDAEIRSWREEQVAHEATKRQLQDLQAELVRISGAEDWEAAIGWVLLQQVALEGAKRQLQRVRERVCQEDCKRSVSGDEVLHSRLCEEIRHG